MHYHDQIPMLSWQRTTLCRRNLVYLQPLGNVNWARVTKPHWVTFYGIDEPTKARKFPGMKLWKLCTGRLVALCILSVPAHRQAFLSQAIVIPFFLSETACRVEEHQYT